MKKIIFIFSFVFLLFFSCVVNNNQTEIQISDNPEQKETPNSGESKKSSIIIKNQSQFDVNIYIDVSPYYNVSPTYTVNKGANYNCQLLPSDETGYTVYIEYLIDIGNAKFPYWDINNSKDLIVQENNSAELIIDSLEKCESKSAYFYIENNTSTDIYLLNGMSYVRPTAQENYLISSGKSAVYEVNEETSAISLGNYSQLKVYMGQKHCELPVTKETVQKGNIYTISISSDDSSAVSASLKAVTPFNIDTQNKIWSADNSMFKTQRSDGSEKKHSIPVCMRPSSDGKSTLVMGTNTRSFTIGTGDNTKRITTDLPGIIRVNEYGEYPKDGDFRTFFFNTNEAETLKRIEVIDFVEQNDGYIVMLLKRCFEDDFYDDYLIICYNFNAQDNQESIKWYKVISPVENPQEYKELVFRKDTKNRLVKVGEDEYICVGACSYYEADSEEYVLQNRRYMLFYANGKLIGKNKNTDDGFKMILSDDGSAAGTERILSSAYFDGSDLYVCGYENWEPSGYTGTHTGKIWKSSISEIKNGNFDFANCEYSKNYCLFFSIDGTGSDFGVCGEYYAKDDGGSLKGCYVTSRMLKENSSCEPKLYSIKDKSYCWFNQLCQYENKIVLCGKADMTMDGSNNPLPFVVAYDYDGNKLWENLSFTEYTDALNIIPNTIGTYMLQLEGKNGIIHYVNADLLGNEKK